MNDDDLRDLLSAVRDLMRPHLARSEPLRRIVHHVGELLIEESRRSQAATSAGRLPQPGDSGAVGGGDCEQPEPEIHDVHDVQITADLALNVGGTSVRVPVRDTAREIARAHAALDTETVSVSEESRFDEPSIEQDEIDLGLLEIRCRLKAESCRLYIDRRAAEGDPLSEPQAVERLNDMIAEAKALPNCFLWVFWRQSPQPEDAMLKTIARCYDAMVHAVGLARQLDRLGTRAKDGDVQEALQLCAEANSALRVALERTWLTSADVDQDEFHRWIRRETSARAVYVSRFIRLDDPADPNAAEDLCRRLGTLYDNVERVADRLKQITEGFKKIEYHVGLLNAGYDAVFDDHHCRKIAQTIEMLADLGVPYSDRGFRRLIDERTAESLPPHHDSSPAVQRVLESVREWRAGLAEVEPSIERTAIEPWSDQVREVRSLLAGGGMVMIGGEPRNDATSRIKDAFGLAEVTWVRLTTHGSGQPMHAPIGRPRTRLVVVLVKLAGHHHAEAAAACAKAAAKPLVMLKAGYNPEQIADAVLRQASEQLRECAPSSDVRVGP